jgi:hypothetical protein
MTYSTALSLTLPSLTSDHRQHLLAEQPLLSLYERLPPSPIPVPSTACARNLARTSCTYICRIFETKNSFVRPPGQLSRLCWLLGTSVHKIGQMNTLKEAFLPKRAR